MHHKHHKPMQGNTSTETHFLCVPIDAIVTGDILKKRYANAFFSPSNSIQITSPSFAGMNQPARHRAVYKVLADELARQGGVHALQLRTKTPEEVQREEQLLAERIQKQNEEGGCAGQRAE